MAVQRDRDLRKRGLILQHDRDMIERERTILSKKSITGIGIGNTCAIGKAYVYARTAPSVQRTQISDTDAERTRLVQAQKRARAGLSRVIDQLSQRDEQSAEILVAQLEFLDDDEYYGAIERTIGAEQINAEAAIDAVCRALVDEFMKLEEEYFRERASDIKDMSERLLAELSGTPLRTLAEISEQVIVVAHDLMPSDTAQFNTAYVLAFCTEAGTATSHTALLANSLGIPAVVGCKSIAVQNDDLLVVDGVAGVVHVRPSASKVAAVKKQIAANRARDCKRIDRAHQPAISRDGVRFSVQANISSAAEAKKAIEYGADGSGLLRTEFFFYHEPTLPTEDLQFELYADIARTIGERPLTVRTLDIGGDKPLPSLQGDYAHERNPFLGVRGVRLTDTAPDLLAQQLRALIRVATTCPAEIKVMFPFISVPAEMQRLRQTFDAIYADLNNRDGKTYTRPRIGAMIEIPSAALMVEHILAYTDFVSIGTNDLAQYTLAADRTNAHVSALADYCSPAVLMLVAAVIRAAAKHDQAVSVCGEMAGDLLVMPLLYGMGLSAYSMAAIRIPHAKELIGRLQRADCAALCEQCLQEESARGVRERLRAFSAAVMDQ